MQRSSEVNKLKSGRIGQMSTQEAVNMECQKGYLGASPGMLQT